MVLYLQRTMRHDLFTPLALGSTPGEKKKFQVNFQLL